MRAGKLRWCLTGAAALALTLAGPAHAKTDAVDILGAGNLFSLTAHLPDRDGYSYSLEAQDHRHVELTASKGAFSVSYAVLGRASTRRMDADFGPLGEVHIRFHLEPELVFPASRDKKKGRCQRRIGLYDGRFRGTVEFTGEATVTGTVAHSGAVSLISFKRACRHPQPTASTSSASARTLLRLLRRRSKPAAEFDVLSAEGEYEGRSVTFTALKVKTDPSGLLTNLDILGAAATERVGRVKVTRSVSAFAEGPALRVSRKGKVPMTVIASPPKPFAGSGLFKATPGVGSSWSGDLAAPLLGLGVVPLTGAEFSAHLCRASSFLKLERCL
ncbi:MAG TPA: hypothetical protein VFI17_00335 [Solirubrobacterales bacterium]|nr:hypothetical protein [Solirubrobacterales bacterium]